MFRIHRSSFFFLLRRRRLRLRRLSLRWLFFSRASFAALFEAFADRVGRSENRVDAPADLDFFRVDFFDVLGAHNAFEFRAWRHAFAREMKTPAGGFNALRGQRVLLGLGLERVAVGGFRRFHFGARFVVRR